ncbi:MAG: Fe-S cluster assembly protein SufD [Chitinophagaceae bacterium]|nr:Fe-S cluster assembly protein SufD [Oligoflexus sp.]
MSETTRQFESAFQSLVNDAQWTPAWLKDLRQTSFEQFAQAGLPSRQIEAWKYTSTRSLNESPFALGHASAIDAETLAARSVAGASRVVFINGIFNAALSELPTDVSITDIREALDTDREMVMPCMSAEDDSLVSLNQAFFSSGVLIKVNKNVTVAKPIQLLFLQDAQSETVLISPRNIIFVEAGAQAQIIESHFGDTKNFTNAVTDVFVKDNAVCQYVLERVLGSETKYVSRHSFHLARDARIETFNLALGGRLNRSQLEFRLNAPGASAKLDGLYIARGDNHIDNVTEVLHLAPHTSSAQLYKGILEDKSRGVFNGKITIVKDAQHVDAQQLNKNLLMSREAEVDSRPQLIIDANDVKCSHGATIGQLDEQELFYLQSRAISLEDAKRMLAKAFIGDVVGRVSGNHFTKHLQDVLQSFGGGAQ